MLPNFLIAGQAKCGTSSLAQYLQQHPDIFISKKKEPRYFTSQPQLLPLGGPLDHKVESWYVKEWSAYQQLFEEVGTEKAVGEASADTMYFHPHTIPLIKEKLGDPKIIILLRHPVKRAFSAWQHLQRDAREELPFREAIAQEPKRIAKNYELIYHYTEVSKYAKGVKAFKENFSQVKVIFNEDLSKNPQQTLREIFTFLEVDPKVEVEAEVRHNLSGIPKNRFLHNLLSEENLIRKLARPFTHLFLSPQKRKQLTTDMKNRNLSRLSISPEDYQWLLPQFEEDIRALEELLGKKLPNWRT